MATFEEQLKTLEGVVERLEKGDLPLEESLALFEQGVLLSEACKTELDRAEGRIQTLTERGRRMESVPLTLEADEDVEEE